MSVVQLDLYDREDLNGSVIDTFTDDDLFFEKFEMRIALRDLGSGHLIVSRQGAGEEFLHDIARSEAFIRVLVPSVSSDYLFGFFIDNRKHIALSSDEDAGRDIILGGSGPLYYLSRAILWNEKYGNMAATVHPEAGLWRFSPNETWNPGKIFDRLMDEDGANTQGTFLPDLTKGFSDTVDSDGNAWSDTFEDGIDFAIGTHYLQALRILQESSENLDAYMNLGSPGSPLMRLEMFNRLGRDLTGTSFGTGTVLWKGGIISDPLSGNILTELEAGGQSTLKPSHVLVKGPDGTYRQVERSGWSPGDFTKAVAADFDNTSGTDTLFRFGRRIINDWELRGDAVQFEIHPGFDESLGHYMPGPPGSDGHFWIGDDITLKTGGDIAHSVLDYHYSTERITGIRMVLDEASDDSTDETAALSWHIVPELNEVFGIEGDLNSGAGICCGPKAPTPSTPGTVTTGRLYYTGGDDNTSGLTDDDYSGSWDVASVIGTVPQRLRTTPQDTYSNSGTGPNPYNAISLPAGSVVTLLYSFPLSDSAAILNAVQNGATWRTVIRSNNRHGVGVDDGAQQNFPEWTIRVFRPGTGFIGTIFDVGDATATVRFDPGSATPSIPMQAAGAAVPSAVGTDYLVVDLGGDHQAPTSGATGFSYRFADQSELDDLPFVLDSVADQNSWLEASGAGGDGTDGPSDELTGDDVGCYAQCDHRHHVTRDRAPTPADDIQGYPEGTFWVQVDQLPRDTATEIIATYLSVDDTDGAAVWLLQSPLPSDPPSPSALAIEEEDGSPSGTFDTLKVPNNSLTDNGDGSGTLAYLLPTHGGRHVVNTVVDPGATLTLDLADGNVHEVTLDDDCTIDFAGIGSVGVRWWVVGHWATFTPTWPSSVIWPDDTEPTWSTDADAVDVVEFMSLDGGVTIYGDAGGSGTGGGATDLDDLTDVTITSPEEDQQLQYIGGQWVNNHRRWEPVTTNPGAGPEIVFDGDDIVMTWADYS